MDYLLLKNLVIEGKEFFCKKIPIKNWSGIMLIYRAKIYEMES